MTRSITSQIASSAADERRVGGDLLEHPALARRDGLGALALGDVGDAGADQPPVGARQAHEAHFAGHGLAGGVAVHPFEHRRLARQRAFDVAARTPKESAAVGLMRAG